MEGQIQYCAVLNVPSAQAYQLARWISSSLAPACRSGGSHDPLRANCGSAWDAGREESRTAQAEALTQVF